MRAIQVRCLQYAYRVKPGSREKRISPVSVWENQVFFHEEAGLDEINLNINGNLSRFLPQSGQSAFGPSHTFATLPNRNTSPLPHRRNGGEKRSLRLASPPEAREQNSVGEVPAGELGGGGFVVAVVQEAEPGERRKLPAPRLSTTSIRTARRRASSIFHFIV